MRFRAYNHVRVGHVRVIGALALILVLTPASAAFALDATDTLPGAVVPSGFLLGHFDAAEYPDDVRDIYQVSMDAGETLEVAALWKPGPATAVRLFGPGAVDPDISMPVQISHSSDEYTPGLMMQVIRYTASSEGVYSIEMRRPSTTTRVDYELYWSLDNGADDDIPGAPLASPLAGTTYTSMLNPVVDFADVLPLQLNAGDTVTLSLAHEVPAPHNDYDLILFGPGTASVFDVGTSVARSVNSETSAETIEYTAGVSGTYYVTVWIYDGSGPYRLETSVAQSRVAVTEAQGADRVATAVEVASLAFPDGAADVVVATARDWPDALGGSALAGALDAPILLTEPSHLSPAVRAALEDLGATRVVVLGGIGAVSAAAYDEIAQMPGVTVRRIAGSDRYETASRIAQETISILGPSYEGRAFVATGGDFPDALAASPISAAEGIPIYLTRPSETPDTALVDRMRVDGVTNVRMLGGHGALSNSLWLALRELDPGVLRLAGVDRYETAVRVAEYGVETCGMSWDGLAITTGRDFPDALAGGVLQGKSRSVMLLTAPDSLNSVWVTTMLLIHHDEITSLRFLGGSGAVNMEVRSEMLQLLQ